MKKLIIFPFIFKIAFALTITEIMYNPEGNDLGREWIEVFNNSDQIIQILSGKNGWRINDGKNHLFEESLTVGPQEIFIIVQDKNLFFKDYSDFKGKLVQANFSLKNESGIIQIYDNNKNLLAGANYQSSCGGNNDGYSIIFENGVCKENKIKGGTPGSLLVADKDINQQSFSANSQLSTITPITNLDTTSTQESNLTQQSISTKETQPTLIISEFLPNPEDNDQGKEFIEIFNYGDEVIDLNKFVLEINKKKIKLSGQIEPEEYFLITNKDYNFYLRNNGEEISLYFNNEKIFSISYQGKAPQGKSFARNQNGDWQFTQPTPGRENVFYELPGYKPDNNYPDLDRIILPGFKSDLSDNNPRNISGDHPGNLSGNHPGNNLASIQSLNQNNLKNEIIYISGALLIIIILVFLVWYKL
ncbi:MAG: hypothetical protein KatS3mg096_147 [Candidatus Parcubacteria bacterium]|nr:MAG: hypothetical protein KatS3mg096_147 [Candidatus Parcubacteria bacterium]